MVDKADKTRDRDRPSKKSGGKSTGGPGREGGASNAGGASPVSVATNVADKKAPPVVTDESPDKQSKIVVAKKVAAVADKPQEDSFFDNAGEVFGAAGIGFALGGPVGAIIGAGLNLLSEAFFGDGLEDTIGNLGGANAQRATIIATGIPGFLTNPVGTIIDLVGSLSGTVRGLEPVQATANVFGSAALGALVGGPIGLFIGVGLRLFAERDNLTEIDDVDF